MGVMSSCGTGSPATSGDTDRADNHSSVWNSFMFMAGVRHDNIVMRQEDQLSHEHAVLPREKGSWSLVGRHSKPMEPPAKHRVTLHGEKPEG
jgi:hypothetical protein